MFRRATPILLFLFSTCALFAADSGRAHFDAGCAAYQRGDLDAAVDLFEKAVEASPNSAPYRYWLGTAYGRQAQSAGKFAQARLALKTRDALEKSVELDPKFKDARFALMEYYLLAPGFMGGGEDKAFAQANALRKLDAVAGHRAWARIYRVQKKPDLAGQEMAKAVQEQPDSADAHFHLGVSHLVDRKFAAAIASFEKSLLLDPNRTDAWFRIGQATALGGGNYVRAEEFLRKYLRTTPGLESPPLARAWYWLGMIQEKTGRKSEARASYSTTLRLSPGMKDAVDALKRVS